jgi:hypothetical protein
MSPGAAGNGILAPFTRQNLFIIMNLLHYKDKQKWAFCQENITVNLITI